MDIVVYSTTKFIGGHGVHIGGAIVDSGKFPWAKNPEKWPEFTAPDDAYHGVVFTEALKPIGNIAYIIHIRTHWLRDTGACHEPVRGVPVPAGHRDAAPAAAAAFGERPGGGQVAAEAPGGGVGELPGPAGATRTMPTPRSTCPTGRARSSASASTAASDAGIKFINSVKLASHLANIGDAKTLVIHPASTTHSQLTETEQAQTGVTPDFIRLSVGIEDIEDIKADLDQALVRSQR